MPERHLGQLSQLVVATTYDCTIEVLGPVAQISLGVTTVNSWTIPGWRPNR